MTNYGPTPILVTVPQGAAYECEMMIWRTGGGTDALSHPGHAAILMRRENNPGPWVYNNNIVVPDMDPTRMRYISFWPTGDSDKYTKTGKAGGVSIYLSTRDGNFLTNHLMDWAMELGEAARRTLDRGGAPRTNQMVVGSYGGRDLWGTRFEVGITLPALAGMRATSLGINMNKVVDWAIAFKASPEFNYTYISKSNNCSGVAVRAMCAGGADAFGAIGGNPSKGTLYMTPNDAQTWGRAVASGIQLVNQMLATINGRVAALPMVGVDLPTVESWKTTSAVSWTRRGTETRAIDAALAVYHANTWATDYPKKFAALVTMISNIEKHMKTPGGRDAAYLQLGRAIIHVVGLVAAQGTAPWNVASYYGEAHMRPA
ncbi:hypothetical protein ACQW02_13400 [Humitalea sp. 24SJ18S-53]|uniref:hypothetical protein n=1 Tax=Humitalea sp. 24SJ18S-53 TaxID=3422307 RepID=UPI003D67ABBA